MRTALFPSFKIAVAIIVSVVAAALPYSARSDDRGQNAVAAKVAEEAFIVDPNGPDKNARQPQVAVDSSGRIHAVFGVGNAIRHARSEDGGRSFQPPVTVGEAGVMALGMRRGPRIAVAGDSLIVTAICGTVGRGKDGDVLAWRSTDQGQTWTGPARLNAVEGSGREGLHGLAGDGQGRAVCVWLDLRVKGMRLYAARSEDGGATWLPDELIYRSPDGSICECCHPSASLGPDGQMAIMWRNQIGGHRDLWIAQSKDFGKHFQDAEKMGERSWLLNSCPMDGGAVAIDPKGRIASIWMSDQTICVTPPGAIDREIDLGPGVQGWIDANSTGFCAVWLTRRGGALRALPSRPNAPLEFNAVEPVLLSAQANDPAIAADPRGDKFVVVWESKEGDRGLKSAVLSISQ